MAGINSTTKLMIHSNTTDGSTTFVSSHVTPVASVTRYGNTVHKTTYPMLDGTSSIYFDGTGDYLSYSSYGPGSGDFTIDLWVRFNSLSNWDTILDCSSTTGWYLRKDYNDDKIKFVDTTWGTLASASAVSVDTWYHVAVVKNSTTLTMYINGTYSNSMTVSGGITEVARNTQVGRRYTSTSEDFGGYMAEIRINQEAVWTTDFTPPTEMYTDPTNWIATGGGVAGGVGFDAWVASGGGVAGGTGDFAPPIVSWTASGGAVAGGHFTWTIQTGDIDGIISELYADIEIHINNLAGFNGIIPSLYADIIVGSTLDGILLNLYCDIITQHQVITEIDGLIPRLFTNINTSINDLISFDCLLPRLSGDINISSRFGSLIGNIPALYCNILCDAGERNYEILSYPQRESVTTTFTEIDEFEALHFSSRCFCTLNALMPDLN